MSKNDTFYITEVEKGWQPLIKEFVEYRDKHHPDVGISQIKEKFGGLRIYIWEVCEELDNLIERLEKRAYKICERCGEDGKFRGDLSWQKTFCDNHYQEEIDRINKYRRLK